MTTRTHRVVLEAAAALLAEGGLAAAAIDAIRGPVRRLGDHHLQVDAFAERLAEETGLPDTGSTRDDFAEQIRRVSAFYSSPVGSVFLQLLAAAAQDAPAAQRLRTRLSASRHTGIEQLWERAVARGEVRADIDPDIALDAAFGPVMWRLMRGRSLTPTDTDSLTAAVLDGLLQRPAAKS